MWASSKLKYKEHPGVEEPLTDSPAATLANWFCGSKRRPWDSKCKTQIPYGDPQWEVVIPWNEVHAKCYRSSGTADLSIHGHLTWWLASWVFHFSNKVMPCQVLEFTWVPVKTRDGTERAFLVELNNIFDIW